MKLVRIASIGLAMTLAWANLAASQERPKLPAPPKLPEGVKSLRDLQYVEGGHERNRLDLYLPEKLQGRLPVIVWIHGGAWRAGSKEDCPAVPLAAKGYAVASVDYRLSQHAVFPAQIEDCKAAIRWLRANAARYHLDPVRIGAWGASAGGHLVALLGTTGNVKELEGNGENLDQSSRVQCVVDWFGRADLTTASSQNNPDVTASVSQLLGGPVDENKDKAAKASPMTYVAKSAAPFLIMHGDKDQRVPLKQSELLAGALKKAGGEVTLQVVEGAGHGGPGFTSPENRKRIECFFAKHLGKRGRENEPYLGRLSLSKAIEFLDAGAHAHENNCCACHGTLAYLAARPALSAATSAHGQRRQALEEFAAKLAAEKFSPRETPALRVSEAVMTASVLAQHDAVAQGKLLPLTRNALDRIWDLQRDDGGWNWVKINEPPSGIDDHFGATMAAIGVGTAADHYADTPQARKGLDGIRRYLREHPPATMHQRGMLLLAAAGVEGLLTQEQVQQTIADLFALQLPDGGWAMSGLGDWKRVDGGLLDRTASDGYGTGFTVYVLRHCGKIAADDPRLRKGVVWLETHQRTSGCWFTRSPRKNDDLSTYVGSTYAVLALDACGKTRDR